MSPDLLDAGDTPESLTAAVVEAAERLRLYRAELARVLGILCGDIGDLAECRRELDPGRPEWRRAREFVVLYNLLHERMQGQLVQMRHWVRSENKLLGTTPLLAMVDDGRLADVVHLLHGSSAASAI